MKTKEKKYQEEQFEMRNDVRNSRKQKVDGLCSNARDKATNDALGQAESKSPLSLPEIRLKLDVILHDYREILSSILGGLQASDTERLKRIKTEAYKQEEKEIDSELEDVQSRLQNDPYLGKTEPGRLPFSKQILGLLVYLLLVSEIFFDAQAFGGLRMWFIAAILVSIGFNIAKLLVVRSVTGWLKRTKKKVWKVAMIAGTFMVMTVLFFLIAKLRAQVLLTSGVTESIGEIAFMAISLVFFCGIWLAHYQTEDIRNDLEENKQRRHDYKRVRELKAREKQLTDRLNELRNMRMEVELDGVQDENETENLFEAVENHYQSTVSQWLSLYLKGRRTKGEEIPNDIDKIEVKLLVQPKYQLSPNGHANHSASRVMTLLILVATAFTSLSSCDMATDELIPIDRRVYLIDRTDEFAIAPSEESTNALCSVDELHQERHVVIRSITSTVTSERLEMNLPGYRQVGTWDESWQGHRDTEYREDQVATFERSAKRTLDSISALTIGYMNTNFLEPFMQELLSLSTQKADDRQMFVFSDLGENTQKRNWISNSKEIQAMSQMSPSVWENLSGIDRLELDGVKIFFIYHPSDSNEELFLIRANYLKHFLEEVGAEVSIQSRVRTITY